MKKLVVIMVSLLGFGLTSCDNSFDGFGGNPVNNSGVNTGDNNTDNKDDEEVYWGDNSAYNIWFCLNDESGKSILAQDKDAIYEVEILYEGVNYKYEGGEASRAICMEPLAIRLNPLSGDIFGFGDFSINSHSKFTITFRGNSWEVEQKSSLNPEDINGNIILDVKINGEDQPSGLYNLFVK